MNRNPHDANKGMNVKSYGELVGGAALALLIAILIFVWISRGRVLGSVDHPKSNHAASPQ